jgi:hypothetical protein
MLVEMLKKNQQFNDLPTPKQELFAILATKFEEDSNAIYLTPEELTDHTETGNKDLWTQFLALAPVTQFIKAEMSRLTDIAQRRALRSLQAQATSGNVAAAREINDLAGIYANKDNNKVVVLHRITRPEVKKNESN